MIGAMKKEAGIALYQLEVEIEASPERVWEALIHETNGWWLPDFHMVGAGSTVAFDARAGGGLVETLPDGGSLLWCTIHLIRPSERTVYLVGHLAPDWGGPTTNHLKLAVEPRGSGSVLKVADAHHGNIDDGNLESLQSGWTMLFTDGMKRFIEEGVRQDGTNNPND